MLLWTDQSFSKFWYPLRNGYCCPMWAFLMSSTKYALTWLVQAQVEQFDIHTPALTIRESFSFSASLRLMDVNVEQREEFVDEVGPACGLISCSLIALPPVFSGCSDSQHPPGVSYVCGQVQSHQNCMICV